MEFTKLDFTALSETGLQFVYDEVNFIRDFEGNLSKHLTPRVCMRACVLAFFLKEKSYYYFIELIRIVYQFPSAYWGICLE